MAVARAGAAAVGARGAECGARPAWSLQPGLQPAPGEVNAAPRPPRGLLLADRAGGAPGGRLTRIGRPGVSASGLGGPEARPAGAFRGSALPGPLEDLGELRQTCQGSGVLGSRWDGGKSGHHSQRTFPFCGTRIPHPPTRVS